MSFQIEEVKTEQAFADIARVLWAGFHNPYNPTTKWFYPALATEGATLDAIRARLVADWQAQAPAVVHWVQAIEPSSGNVVGVAQWDVHEKADELESEPQQPPIDPPWHVEGSEERRFAGIFLTRLRDAMEENLPRPHLGMWEANPFPLPSYHHYTLCVSTTSRDRARLTGCLYHFRLLFHRIVADLRVA